jgi:hypothetical protein
MATVIRAPEKYDVSKGYSIFLAGSIDQGKARPWDLEIIKALEDFDVTILSPRRLDWDDSWTQEASDPQFREQVTWEWNALARADMLVCVFTADSKAPISFYEWGRFSTTKKDALVCVEEGFYRTGNLDLYAEFDKTPVYHSLNELLEDLKALLAQQVSQSGKGEATHEKTEQQEE